MITEINGTGMVLTVDGEEQRGFVAAASVRVKGDSQVSCRLISGPIRDCQPDLLPSVTMRGCSGSMGQRFSSTAQTVLVFSVADEVTVLGRCWVITTACSWTLIPACWISRSRAAAASSN